MKQHLVKCWPEHFAALTHPDPNLRKMAELRLNDRDYQSGDWLVITEYDPEQEKGTGNIDIRLITHVLSGGPWLADGYVMLSLLPGEETNHL